MMPDNIDVLVVGAGPAGLSAAAALKARGIECVMVVDREAEPGGIPRFCPHPTFGLTDYFRPMSGPAYARRLASKVDPRLIATATTVTAISPDMVVTLSTPAGEHQVEPKRVLLATGIRETPRAARLVSGDRPLNVLTTGALQRMVAVTHDLPFRRPLIVGTELVSFSAVLTLRDCGVAPVAMIESGPRIRTLKPADLVTRLVLRTPVLTLRRLVSINAAPTDPGRLQSVTIADSHGLTMEITCDAVIFTGGFVPEAALLSRALTDEASLGPAIDQCWRLADPRLYAAGNILRSVETAAWSAREGAAAANAIADDLADGTARPARRVPVVCTAPVKLVTPAAIAVPGPRPGPQQMHLRMERAATGRLTLAVDGRRIWSSPRFTALPDRRLAVTRNLPDLADAGILTVGFDESR
jgi:NADPH-dependent 2,4-dienoyl-CoA reductase/sulfur reductase-like enzyme